jgi:phage protein D
MMNQSKPPERHTINKTQADKAFLKERAAERAENAAKTERLRNLRLAKEADARAAEAQALQEKADKAAAKQRAV